MVAKDIDISSLIQNKHAISSDSVSLLHQWSKQMPWCAAYHILLANGYGDDQPYLQKKYIRQAATYTGDREVLFRFLSGEYLPTSEIESETKIEVSEALPVEILDESIAKELLSPAQEVKKIETNDDQEDNLKSVASEVEKAEVKYDESIDELSYMETEKEDIHTGDVILEEDSEKIDFDKIVVYDPLEELEKHIPEATPQRSKTVPFDFVVYDPEAELAKIADEKEEEEHDFLFWINNREEDNNPSEKGKSVDHVQQLLDQFLATKRNRPIHKQEFYKAESKVEESGQDKMEVISETLLELYIKQGYISKAVKGYQKLSLQNPDKSAYFAARIIEIQQS